MSELTDRLKAGLEKIASKLGGGLTATLTLEPSETYDIATGEYTSTGSPETWSFACAPVYSARESARGAGDEALGANPRFVMPAIARSDNTLITPRRGDRLTVSGVTYQITGVVPISIGDGIAGFNLELST